MGQKVSPTGLRIGINKDWESNGMLKKTFLNIYQTIIKFVNI